MEGSLLSLASSGCSTGASFAALKRGGGYTTSKAFHQEAGGHAAIATPTAQKHVNIRLKERAQKHMNIRLKERNTFCTSGSHTFTIALLCCVAWGTHGQRDFQKPAEQTITTCYPMRAASTPGDARNLGPRNH